MRASLLQSIKLLALLTSLTFALVACQGADEPETKKEGTTPENEKVQPIAHEGAPTIDTPVESYGTLGDESIAKLKAGGESGKSVIKGNAPLTDKEILGVASTVTTSPGQIPRLKLKYKDQKVELPLEHTHVRAEISGMVARVEVTQSYQNPFDEAIETIYVFPLPENSAVDAMRMEIGERVVEAEIQKRQQARETYEAAKAEGFTAALLEQERPNIFTQSVANIAPNSRIKIVTSYVQDMTYDAGQVEFVFPMVVGPRYIPHVPADGMEAIAKSYDEKDPSPLQPTFTQDTAAVGDASRITPPILGAGLRSGHDVSIEILGDPGFPVQEILVPTHEVATEIKEDGSFELMLAEMESIPNRDFVMRYDVAGEETAATIMTTRDPAVDEHGYFTLMVQPPELDLDALVGQREFIFVVDISGSMSGRPLEMCKDAMRLVLTQLRPVDTFNIISFESRDAQVFPSSRPANDTNIKDGLDFVDAMRAGGGTELGNAVQAALGAEPDGQRHRYVFFMTDARIGGEAALLSQTEELLKRYEANEQKARVFTFGVGRSPNHYLIEKLAQVGNGVPIYSTLKEDPGQAVNRFFQLVDHSVLEHLSIDWGGLQVDEVYPKMLPDLFASRPLMVHGRYAKGGVGVVQLKGYHNKEPLEINLEVSLPEIEEGDRAQSTLWARAKIDELERDLWGGDNAQVIEAITQTGLDHRIVTAYTSFVAVDRSVKVGDGDPKKVVQPGEALEDPVDGNAPFQVGGQLAPSSDMNNLLGTGSTAQGFDSTTAWGSLDGAPAGATHGNYGLGMSGAGLGGGGASNGGFGTGGLGVKGSGGGGGGRSYGKGSGKKVKTSKPRLRPARPDVSGSLDKRIVRKVINQHKRELKACYEKELLKDSSLRGKIVVKWTIDTSGKVSDAIESSNSMGNEKVSKCIVKSISRWRFPAPKGGGLVVVSYPFAFEASGGSGSTSDFAVSVGGTLVTNDPIVTEGTRTTEALLETIDQKTDEMIGCGALHSARPEEGKFTLKWTLTSSGHVLDASISADDDKLKDYGTCVMERLEDWRFPEVEGEDSKIEWVHEIK